MLTSIKTVQGYLILAPHSPTEIKSNWFTADFWKKKQAIEGSSKGRYITWFIHHQNNHWVLRHYWRGGFISKWSKDSYFYKSLHNTRAYAELELLATLYQKGFPVPKPIAANVIRKGLFYHADILIERIADATDLVILLAKKALSDNEWQNLGQCIAKFHLHGVYHADLNAKNIMLSPTGFHLIDFDRGQIKSISSKWQQANLARLLRSFKKETNKNPHMHFTDSNWQQLLMGYHKINQLIP